MLSFDPTATPTQLKNALFSSVDPITGLTHTGASVNVQYGRVNAYEALLALGASAPSPDPSPSPSPSPSASASPSSGPTSSSSTPPPSSSPPSTTSSTPAPTESPSSSSSPVPQVFTFSGSLSKQNPTRSFSVTLPAGAVEARLSFKRSPELDLALLDGGHAVVATRSGPSVVTLDVDVASGSYFFTVGGGRCNFTLAVTTTPT
jgi:hypothetical protein